MAGGNLYFVNEQKASREIRNKGWPSSRTVPQLIGEPSEPLGTYIFLASSGTGVDERKLHLSGCLTKLHLFFSFLIIPSRKLSCRCPTSSMKVGYLQLPVYMRGIGARRGNVRSNFLLSEHSCTTSLLGTRTPALNIVVSSHVK